MYVDFLPATQMHKDDGQIVFLLFSCYWRKVDYSQLSLGHHCGEPSIHSFSLEDALKGRNITNTRVLLFPAFRCWVTPNSIPATCFLSNMFLLATYLSVLSEKKASSVQVIDTTFSQTWFVPYVLCDMLLGCLYIISKTLIRIFAWIILQIHSESHTMPKSAKRNHAGMKRSSKANMSLEWTTVYYERVSIRDGETNVKGVPCRSWANGGG